MATPFATLNQNRHQPITVQATWLPDDVDAIDAQDHGRHVTWAEALRHITTAMARDVVDRDPALGALYLIGSWDTDDGYRVIERVFEMSDGSQWRAYIDTPDTPHN